MSQTVRLFDEDPLCGTRTLFVTDDDSGDFRLITQQDHEPFMAEAQYEFNLHPSGAAQNWKGDLHKVASIPMPLWMELCRKGIAFDEMELRKWLDDSDNAPFRTKPGSLSR